MLIIWGKKEISQDRGFVADFCPVCRVARMFKLTTRGLVNHIYGCRVGAFEPFGYSKQCLTCCVGLEADIADYQSVAKDSVVLDVLLEQTLPNFEDKYSEQLELAEKIRLGGEGLDHGTKQRVIMEPFAFVYPIVHKRFEQTHLDLVSLAIIVFGFMGVGIFGGMIMALLERFSVSPDDAVPFVLLPLFAVYVLIVMLRFSRVRRIFFERSVLPVFRIAFAHVKPKKEDIPDILRNCIKGGLVYWRKAKVQWLLDVAK